MPVSFAVGIPNVREYADPRLLVELAVAAEAAGWDGVFLWDHIAREEDRRSRRPIRGSRSPRSRRGPSACGWG